MRTSRKLFALLLAVMFVVSCFTSLGITASATSTVYFDPGAAAEGDPAWFAWTWDGVTDQWVTGVTDGNYIRFDGVGNKIVFVRMPSGSTAGDWGSCWNQSDDLTVSDNLATFSSWNNQKFNVTWSHYDGGGDNPPSEQTQPTQSTQITGTSTVYYKNTSSWSSVFCYMWSGEGNPKNAEWPGEAMTSVGNNVYKYTFSGSFEKVIFNNGSGGAGNQTDDLSFPGDGQIYDNGSWSVFGDDNPTQGSQSTQQTQATQYTGPTAPYNPGDNDQGLASYYSTNKNGFGANKTISSYSDWDSSMLIAQGTANDDPRVYRDNSMYELPIDLYALYGAYDDNNLYLMWEMTNVQDVVAPSDNYPLSQGILFETQELPFFIAIDTGKGDAVGNNGALQTGGTIWDSGLTFQNSFNRLISINTKGGNGPFVYSGDASGLNAKEILDRTTSKISMRYGKGILSQNVYGLDGAYGPTSYDNPRTIADMCNESGKWVDFNTKGHSSATMDFHYELTIPYSELGISKSDVVGNGVGAMVVATFGKSGMDSLPYDLSMNDNADQPDTQSQPNNSFEKSDEDFVKTSFARIGKAGSTQPTQPQTQATEPQTQYTEPQTQATQPQTQATQPQTQQTQPQTQATQPQTQATQPQTQATQPQTQAPSLTASVKLNGTQVKSVNVSGNTLTVAYNLTAPLPITDGDLELSYDSSKLTLSEVTTPKITGGNIANSPSTSANPYKINFTGINQSTKSGLYNFTSGGVLVQAKFSVNSGASGTASVNLKINELDALQNGTTTSYFSDAMATSAGQSLVSSLSNPTAESSGGSTPTQGTQPQTQATQPQTQATQPQTQGTQPQTQPQTQATQTPTGSTQATQPQTQATQPQTQPTQTPTGSTQATTPTQAPGPQYSTAIVAVAESSKIYVGASTNIIVSVTNGMGKTKFTSSNTKIAVVNSSGKVTGKKAGTVTIKATNNNKTASVKIKVVQRNNPMTVKAKTVSASTKKNTTIKKAKAFTIKNAKGTVTFKKSSGDKKITINKKTGNITVKKGLKKGKTFKFKVKVTAKGNTTYKAKSKTVTVKIKVK